MYFDLHTVGNAIVSTIDQMVLRSYGMQLVTPQTLVKNDPAISLVTKPDKTNMYYVEELFEEAGDSYPVAFYLGDSHKTGVFQEIRVLIGYPFEEKDISLAEYRAFEFQYEDPQGMHSFYKRTFSVFIEMLKKDIQVFGSHFTSNSNIGFGIEVPEDDGSPGYIQSFIAFVYDNTKYKV